MQEDPIADASGARFRMWYSFESRLCAVRLAASGVSMAEVAGREPLNGAPLVPPLLGRGRERSSWPPSSPRRLTAEAKAEITALRRAAGARPVAPARSALTVGKALRLLGLSRPAREPKPSYERERASCCTSTSRS